MLLTVQLMFLSNNFYFVSLSQLPVADPFLDKLDFGDLGNNHDSLFC